MLKLEEFEKILSENLCYYRTKNNMLQKEVAEKLNVNLFTVSRWETGRRVPDIYTLYLLSRLYDVSLDDLLEKKDIDETSKIRKEKKN